MQGFRAFSEAFDQEKALLTRLPQMSIIHQIETDIALHRKAITANTFDGKGTDFLRNDIPGKEKLLSTVKALSQGRDVNPKEIIRLKQLIKFDQNTHRRQLQSPSFSATGSRDWHKMWIGIYDGWLSFLNRSA